MGDGPQELKEHKRSLNIKWAAQHGSVRYPVKWSSQTPHRRTDDPQGFADRHKDQQWWTTALALRLDQSVMWIPSSHYGPAPININLYFP